MKIIQPGDKFGRLTVLRETTKEERKDKAGRNYWCKCDCGNEIIVYGHNLKTGNTKSCGCLSREIASKNNTIDIPIGTRFGSLIVLERAPINHYNHLAYWKCQCDCGNTINVAGARLRNGEVTSCGCMKYPNRINEVGNVYGSLIVLKYAGSTAGGGARWLCECDCGNQIIVEGTSLRSGHTRSCGCIKSYKEKEINQLLQSYNIEYATQYCFKDLITEKGGYPRFDFAIFSNHQLYCLIEYQGEQHIDINNKWYSEDYIERDKLKYQYCKDNNIKLYYCDKNTNLEEFIKKLIIEMEK